MLVTNGKKTCNLNSFPCRGNLLHLHNSLPSLDLSLVRFMFIIFLSFWDSFFCDLFKNNKIV